VPEGRVSSWELLVGMAGLAISRGALRRTGEQSRRRIDNLRELLGTEGAQSDLLPATELDAEAGYALWSTVYDAPGNPLIAVEEPIVRRLLDRAPAGRALDAACGTGRHLVGLPSLLTWELARG
jgi:hypothetical protein